jgi:hypothetical protein
MEEAKKLVEDAKAAVLQIGLSMNKNNSGNNESKK